MTRDNDGTLLRPVVYRPLPLTYPLSQCDATKKTIEHCCALAGAGDAVPLAWMLLRDARALHRVTQTRRAAMECGSAAELAIKALLDSRNVARKPRLTLGPLSDLLRKNGYPLHPDFETSFLEVRNREIHMNHGAGSVTETESLRMLEIATHLVEEAFPLPHGIQKMW